MQDRNLSPRNEKGQPNGYWEIAWFRGNYVNAVLFGLCEWDYANPQLQRKNYYAI